MPTARRAGRPGDDAVIPGGIERRKDEFTDLFARAGLRLRRVVATKCPLSIMEGVRA